MTFATDKWKNHHHGKINNNTTPDGTKHGVNKKGDIALCAGLLLKDVLFVPIFTLTLSLYIKFVLIWM